MYCQLEWGVYVSSVYVHFVNLFGATYLVYLHICHSIGVWCNYSIDVCQLGVDVSSVYVHFCYM